MAEGQAKPAGIPELRAAAPHRDGPLGSSGAAPEQPLPTDASPPAARPEPTGPSPSGEATATTSLATDSGTAKEPASGGSETPPPAKGTSGDGASATASPAPANASATPSTADATPGTAAAALSTASAAPGTADAAASAVKTESSTAAAATGAGTPPAGGKRGLLRRINPVRGARRVGRGLATWARRPTGRLVLPAIIVVLLLGAAGTAGAYLVPAALRSAASPSATPGFLADGGAPSAPASLPGGGGPLLPGASGAPLGSSTLAQQPAVTGQRPADVLAGWAQQVGTKVGIPVVAVQAYGYAELVVAKQTPSCHLSWTTIAAIAKVESNHGSYNGSVLAADGEVQPPIYGLPLDGKGGRQLVRDTDQGTIDGDTTYDRAVGPLQFIPSTWLANKVDADNNGVADPNNINDASLTAAEYLCKGGRDMSRADSWWEAILSYNAVQPYAQKVFDTANDYGQRSRV